MKRATAITFVVFVVAVLVAMVASAKGLLPCMVYRRGLTNEQIDFILERHPDAQLRMTAQDWQAMRYQLCRFDCMTNYVELIGGSNDCARVLLQLHDDATTAWSRYSTASNMLVRTQRSLDDATERAQEYADAYANATNNLQSIMADYMSASNRADRAEARTASVIAWAEEQRDKAILPSTKELWQKFIDKLKGDK